MKKWLQIVALAAACSAYGQGTYEAIFQYVGSPVSALQSGTVGWAFQPLLNFEISHIGAFRNAIENNNGQVTVGLWDASGSLILSNNLTPGDILINQSRYVVISPITLLAGQVYYIGAYSPLGLITVNTVGPQAGGLFATAPQIQYLGLTQNTNGFAQPFLVQGGEALLYAGPNFIIPEPSVLSCFFLGAFSLLCWMKSRRQ